MGPASAPSRSPLPTNSMCGSSNTTVRASMLSHQHANNRLVRLVTPHSLMQCVASLLAGSTKSHSAASKAPPRRVPSHLQVARHLLRAEKPRRAAAASVVEIAWEDPHPEPRRTWPCA